jgi:hypothetical protein
MSVASPPRGLSPERTKRDRLQRAALDTLMEHEARDALPTSIRFLFYELEQKGIVSKTKAGARRPDQDLQEAVPDLSTPMPAGSPAGTLGVEGICDPPEGGPSARPPPSSFLALA